MNKSAVLHIPASQYAFAQETDVMTFRLRAAKGDLDACTLYWGDRASMDSPVTFVPRKMRVIWQDEWFEYYEETISGIPVRVCYYFQLNKKDEQYYYYADAFHTAMPDRILEDGFVVEGRSEYYQYPYILRSEIIRMPEWFENAVVYNIFPDSFASDRCFIEGKSREIEDACGNRFRSKCGGTIEGIRKNLDYIEGLGFTCLYLNPVFEAGEYHKYDIVEYYRIDPCMGTEEEFRALVEEVHARKMHIIIDGVFNHCSWYFPFFDDVVRKGETSIYKDWFYELSFPVKRPEEGELPEYACFAYEPKMPKLNTANPDVQEYFAGVGRYFIEKFRVDGWRLDVANEVDKSFWRRFRMAVKEADPQAVIIGEVWENADQWLKGDLFDSVMNYDFRKHCREFFALGNRSADTFAYAMTDMLLRYPAQVTRGQLNLLDSHDVCRFLSLCGGSEDRWRLAFLYLCMAPGVPSVFYGDEKLVTGMKEPEYRRAMPWEAGLPETEEFVRQAIRIRRDWIAPADEWRIVRAEEGSGLLVFERRGRQCVRVLLNNAEVCVDVEDCHEEGQMLMEKGTRGNYLEGYGYQVILLGVNR